MMENNTAIPFSILDLARVIEGGDVAKSFSECVSTAQTAEGLGYERVWYAEHHNMISVASSATSVLIAHVAANTKSIRLGSGGIMLPNHSPLTIAEQFGTLATLHPDRIDLGLGRAPGGDHNVIRALRKHKGKAADRFPDDVLELIAYLAKREGDNFPTVRAIPGEGTEVPVWILGSSLFGAQLAAQFGLPYAFASHFAPQLLTQAADIYRNEFQPSKYLDEPYFMMACNVFAADTEEEAEYHFSSLIQGFVGMLTNRRGLVKPPIENYQAPLELSHQLNTMLQGSAVGSPEQVAERLAHFQAQLEPDEYMISMPFYDHEARLKSMQLTMDIQSQIETSSKVA